jgi:uncharacterized protein YggE
VDGELVVRGVGEVRTMPDLASVWVGVDGEGQSRDEAYKAASTAAAAVDLVLVEYESVCDRVTTAALAVEPTTRWRKGENQRTGWHALRLAIVEVKDTSAVGELLNALAGAGGNISRLTWTVAPTNEAFALARRQAGEDARARAEQYASALNIGLGPVAWASEPGLRGTGPVDGEARATTRRAMAAGAPEEPIEVNPEEVTVRAALDVGYRIGREDDLPNG